MKLDSLWSDIAPSFDFAGMENLNPFCVSKDLAVGGASRVGIYEPRIPTASYALTFLREKQSSRVFKTSRQVGTSLEKRKALLLEFQGCAIHPELTTELGAVNKCQGVIVRYDHCCLHFNLIN